MRSCRSCFCYCVCLCLSPFSLDRLPLVPNAADSHHWCEQCQFSCSCPAVLLLLLPGAVTRMQKSLYQHGSIIALPDVLRCLSNRPCVCETADVTCTMADVRRLVGPRRPPIGASPRRKESASRSPTAVSSRGACWGAARQTGQCCPHATNVCARQSRPGLPGRARPSVYYDRGSFHGMDLSARG